MSPPPSGPGRAQSRFYGKYRGVVINNIDPVQIGRIQAQVPDVLGEIPSELGVPVCAGGRPPGRLLHHPADRLAGLDRVRAGRSRLSNMDRRLLGTGCGRAGAGD